MTTRRSPRSSGTSRRSPSCPTCGWARGRRRAVGPRARRRSTACGRSRGRSPGRSRGSTCPAGTASGRRSRRTQPPTARPGSTRSRGSRATGRSCAAVLDNAEMSLAKADMGVARHYAALARGDGDARRWAAIEAEFHRTVALLRRDHRPRAAARRRAGAPALDRAAQPVRRLALGAPGAAARSAPVAAARRSRSAAGCCGSSS